MIPEPKNVQNTNVYTRNDGLNMKIRNGKILTRVTRSTRGNAQMQRMSAFFIC